MLQLDFRRYSATLAKKASISMSSANFANTTRIAHFGDQSAPVSNYRRLRPTQRQSDRHQSFARAQKLGRGSVLGRAFCRGSGGGLISPAWTRIAYSPVQYATWLPSPPCPPFPVFAGGWMREGVSLLEPTVWSGYALSTLPEDRLTGSTECHAIRWQPFISAMAQSCGGSISMPICRRKACSRARASWLTIYIAIKEWSSTTNSS